MQMLQELASTAARPFETVEQCIDAVLNLAHASLGIPVPFIARTNHGRHEVVGIAVDGQAAEPGMVMPLEAAYCQYVVRERAPLVVTDARKEQPFASMAATQEFNVGSCVGVPLIMSSGEVFGTLCGIDAAPRHFSQQDVGTLVILGRLVVNQIEHADTIAQLRTEHGLAERRRRIAEGRQETLEALNAGKPLPELLAMVATNARSLLGAGGIGIYTLDPETRDLALTSASGLPPGMADRLVWPEGVGPVGWALRHHDCFLGACDETAAGLAGDDSPAAALARHFSHELAVPVLYGGALVGVIALWYREAPEPLREHLVLGRALADQVALVTEHCRLQRQAAAAAGQTERNRLARDLHDGATQTLFAASLLADTLPHMIQQDPADALEAAGEISRLCRGSLIEMRSLLLELRSESLEGMAAGDLLGQLCAAFEARTSIKPALAVESPSALPVAVKRTLYRVTQEALSNVVKSARAGAVSVTLAPGRGGSLDLTIADNGRGFDPTVTRPGHLGLGMMRERAAEIGAQVTVTSNPGAGTTIQLACPPACLG